MGAVSSELVDNDIVHATPHERFLPPIGSFGAHVRGQSEWDHDQQGTRDRENQVNARFHGWRPMFFQKEAGWCWARNKTSLFGSCSRNKHLRAVDLPTCAKVSVFL